MGMEALVLVCLGLVVYTYLGYPVVLAAWAALRQPVWSDMSAARVTRFPGAAGRIPNFKGAEAAAERLRATAAPNRRRVRSHRPPGVRRPGAGGGVSVRAAVRGVLRLEPGMTPTARAAAKNGGGNPASHDRSSEAE